MYTEPKISVITPSYNQGQFIEETILSVLNQTYKNIQYILIDGGSTDNTMAIVNKYKDRIDIIIHEKDKGQSDAINKGFKLANGELVGWINSDDILYNDCVEKIVELYKANNDGSIYHSKAIDVLNIDGVVTGRSTYYIPDANHLLNENYFVVQPGSFYSNRMLKSVNYIDESIHYCMDLELWLRLLTQGPIYSYNDHPIATIRKWEGTKTSTGQFNFLLEIKDCLIKHGGKKYSKNIYNIYYRLLRVMVKESLKKVFKIKFKE